MRWAATTPPTRSSPAPSRRATSSESRSSSSAGPPSSVPGRDTPPVLLDGGAHAECTAEYLVQFAQMGAVFARHRFGIEAPKVGLLSIGEEPTKGNPLVKETHKLLAAGEWIGATG